jgi:hypothetical protein
VEEAGFRSASGQPAAMCYHLARVCGSKMSAGKDRSTAAPGRRRVGLRSCAGDQLGVARRRRDSHGTHGRPESRALRDFKGEPRGGCRVGHAALWVVGNGRWIRSARVRPVKEESFLEI